MERFRLIHLSQTGVFDNLQLVYLQHIKRQRGYDGRLSERFVGVLARQSENDMSADIDSSFSRLFDDASCTLEVVPPVDSPQRIVVGRFDTIFYRHKSMPVQLFEIIKQRIRNTIGTGSYGNTYHIIALQCLLVYRF